MIMSKRNNHYGPWSMSVVQECRLDAFWKKRFDALDKVVTKPSRRDWVFGFALLAMLVALPSWQLGPRNAIGDERPISTLPYQRTTAVAAPKSTVAQPIPPMTARPGLPKPKRNELTLSLYVGQKHKLGMPDDCKVTVGAPDIFGAETDEHGDVTIDPKTSGEGMLKFEFDNRASFEMKIIVAIDPGPLTTRLDKNGFNNVRVGSLSESVVLTGQVQTIDQLSRCIALAEELYPKVINNIRVGLEQQVQLNCKVIEFEGDEAKVTAAIEQLCKGHIVDKSPGMRSALLDGAAYDSIVKTLRESLEVNVLAEPVLTTISGRPAAFHAGAEFPILIPQGLNTVAVEYKQLGPRVDFVPVVLGNGRLRLGVRPQISQMESSNPPLVVGDNEIPRLNTRSMETTTEMKLGQTVVVALVDQRPDGKHRCFLTITRPDLVSPGGATEVPTALR